MTCRCRHGVGHGHGRARGGDERFGGRHARLEHEVAFAEQARTVQRADIAGVRAGDGTAAVAHRAQVGEQDLATLSRAPALRAASEAFVGAYQPFEVEPGGLSDLRVIRGLRLTLLGVTLSP